MDAVGVADFANAVPPPTARNPTTPRINSRRFITTPLRGSAKGSLEKACVDGYPHKHPNLGARLVTSNRSPRFGREANAEADEDEARRPVQAAAGPRVGHPTDHP